MSLIRLIITDKTSVLTGEIHGSEADAFVASLASEPETLDELALALARFRDSESDCPIDDWFRRSDLNDPSLFVDYLDLEPHDAGIVVIDLAGRTFLCDSSCDSYSLEGTIQVNDRLSDCPSERGFPLPYRIPDDWMIMASTTEFETEAQHRRETRLAKNPRDYRPVLYGEPMLWFIVEEMFSAENPTSEHIVAPIHEAWLMLARDDLDGKTPREVLHEKRDLIDFDLHSRSLQYSFTKDCPPDLSSGTYAYKYAGFGTHEIVVYYDMIRFLIDRFRKWIAEDGKSPVDMEVARLAKVRDQWLREPEPDYSGRTPNQVLESERKRRNLTMSAQESIIDEDCPICVEMSQIFDTPMFWHLDGCNMDELFAFSFHDTVEDWEREQAEWLATSKECTSREILGIEKKSEIGDDPDDFIAHLRGEMPPY